MRETRKCKCGNLFVPFAERQRRCLHCILKEEPPKPKDHGDGIMRTDFVEWFIFHWHHVRVIGAAKKGVVLEWDDGIVEYGKDGSRDG